jgi:hypothetical protein
MSLKVGRAVAWDKHSTLIEFESSCGTCRGCATQRPKQLRIVGNFDHAVQIELSAKKQLAALFNSLLLPVLIAVLLAFVADWLRLNELYGIILVFGGFTLGMALCQRLSPAALLVTES